MEQNTGMINKKILIHKKFPALCITMLFFLVMAVTSGCGGNNAADTAMDTAMDTAVPPDLSEQSADIAQNGNEQLSGETPGAVGDVVDIEDGNNDDKMVAVSMEAVGRANPFVPANDTSVLQEKLIPKESLPKFDLVEPPTGSDMDSDAAKVVTTKISGIMFDKYNPSAIINIEDTDYLVRSGDVINGYKILAISPQTVTVQLGSNIYKAGVGEIVTKDEGINYNQISNLSKKFGGARK